MSEPFIRVASRKEIPEGRCKLVRVGDEPIALWLVNGRLYAIRNICPHQHFEKLHEGTIEDGKYLTCPMHGWSFCLTDGKARSGSGRAKTYPVRLDGDSVLIEMSDPE